MTRLHTDADPSAKRVLVIHGKRLLGFIAYIAAVVVTVTSWSTTIDGMSWSVVAVLCLIASTFFGILFCRWVGSPITEERRYGPMHAPQYFSPLSPTREAHQRILQSILTALWMRELFLAFQYLEVVRRLEGE